MVKWESKHVIQKCKHNKITSEMVFLMSANANKCILLTLGANHAARDKGEIQWGSIHIFLLHTRCRETWTEL